MISVVSFDSRFFEGVKRLQVLPLLGEDRYLDILEDRQAGKMLTTWKDRVIPLRHVL